MLRKLFKLFGCLVLLAVLAVAAIAAALRWGWQELHEPRAIPGGEDGVVVQVEPGTGAGAILGLLEEHGVLERPELARLYLGRVLDDPPLHHGEYHFSGEMRAVDVLEKLIEGDVVLHSLTVIEGLTLDETADAIAEAGFGDREVLRELVHDPAPITDLDPGAENLEGYLYPETYSFPQSATEREVIEAMVGAFRRLYEDRIANRLDGVMSLRDLVTLASIVEKEAQEDSERPLIASVYANRLRIGMGLYADPTIIYAKKRAGNWDGNLTRRDLALDSPYNTYVVPGLPPSPICSPTVESLEAALDPAETPFLYFVSRNDGTHVFAETLREHNQNVDRWQRRYWREKRQKGN